MIVQSCVKDINILSLSGAVVDSDNVYITITVDSETPQDTVAVAYGATISFPTEICFEFDTANTTTVISRYPTRGKFIQFDIKRQTDSVLYGTVTAFFPNPTAGSSKSAFKTETKAITPTATLDGDLQYSLYHQIKTSSVFLKIANRNFNVYRQCFSVHTLCLYAGGQENPTTCVSELTTSHLQVYPTDAFMETEEAANLLDGSTSTYWTVSPTQPALPTGVDMGECWAPFSQYIVVNLNAISADVPAISAISLGFDTTATTEISGDAAGSPPRYLTFAFDANLVDLTSYNSDVSIDQFWAVDLHDSAVTYTPETNNIYTINPLFFQLDANPATNQFRMTQITKGFGLQYVSSASLAYQTTTPSSWSTYVAAYIALPAVNTLSGSGDGNQTLQLATVACNDLFPTQSPSVSAYYSSGTYGACWGYAPAQNYECYDSGSSAAEVANAPLYYPPFYYLIHDTAVFTTSDVPYCALSLQQADLFTNWGECDIGELIAYICPNTGAVYCDSGGGAITAIPMGWECNVPQTLEPTTEPTASPTKAPTKSPTDSPSKSPTKNPTDSPSASPTKEPTEPTKEPTVEPTSSPSDEPTTDPTVIPSEQPTAEPTDTPTSDSGEVDGSTTKGGGRKDDTLTGQEADSTVIVVVSVVGVVLLLLVIGGLVYLYCRTKNVPKEKEDAYRVQMAMASTSNSNVNGIERAEQGGEQEEAMEMEGSPAPGAQHQMQNIETEGQSMPRENPDAEADDENDDILKHVNQTFGSDFEHDDNADIVERVNSLTAGNSDGDMDVVSDVNETIGGTQD